MLRLIIIIPVVSLIFGFSGVAQAQAPAEGVITGQVVNGTENGGSVEGTEVTLLIYIDATLAETRDTTADDEGRFRFEDIVIGYSYIVSAKYMGVDYYYPVEFEPGNNTAFIEVGVCDTTASDDSIVISLCHTIVTMEEEKIKVTQVFWLFNDSDRTYVGTDNILVFSLPEDAYSFSAPQELMQDFELLPDNKVSYLVPFPPGERQLVFAYDFAGEDSADITIPLSIDYPTDIFELMVGGEDIEVSVSQLAPADPVYSEDGERFIHYQGTNLSRGIVVELNLHSLSRNSTALIIIICVIIAIVLSGIVVYLLRRSKVSKSRE